MIFALITAEKITTNFLLIATFLKSSIVRVDARLLQGRYVFAKPLQNTGTTLR